MGRGGGGGASVSKCSLLLFTIWRESPHNKAHIVLAWLSNCYVYLPEGLKPRFRPSCSSDVVPPGTPPPSDDAKHTTAAPTISSESLK